MLTFCPPCWEFIVQTLCIISPFLWAHMCVCPVVSRKFCIINIVFNLWPLQYFSLSALLNPERKDFIWVLQRLSLSLCKLSSCSFLCQLSFTLKTMFCVMSWTMCSSNRKEEIVQKGECIIQLYNKVKEN